MNNDQQNANLQPPVSQIMPTMQPMPDQSPQVTPATQPLPSQSPQMANQQSAVEPEEEAATNPNDAPKGIIQQHREFINSSNNRHAIHAWFIWYRKGQRPQPCDW